MDLFELSCGTDVCHIINPRPSTCPYKHFRMTAVAAKETVPLFNGSNWEDLDRQVALAKFHFLLDDDYDDNEPRRCAYLSTKFIGPALDWASSIHTANPQAYEAFEGFVVAVKQAFGVEANGLQALRRKGLDDLRWGSDVPVFFAEFDRLTLQLGITDHGTKIIMVQHKLPVSVKSTLALQALDFANYETMRERLITMWALDPTRHGQKEASHKSQARTRCGACGKKGHTAANCRGGSKN